MKIVDRKTFLAMPPGTLFSTYKPVIFDELCIKGETWGNDFLVQEINSAVRCDSDREMDLLLERAQNTGESVDMDFDCQSRDGLYDEEQLFAVWERKDVESLINRLRLTLE